MNRLPPPPDRARLTAGLPDFSTPPLITLWLVGHVAPGGSKTGSVIPKRGGGFVTGKGGRPIVVQRDAGVGNAEWKRTAALQAKALLRTCQWETPLEGPLAIRVTICRKPPQKPEFPWPAVMPDATKLWRSTEDALTGILWADDARIVRQQVDKVYWQEEGALVEVWECPLKQADMFPKISPTRADPRELYAVANDLDQQPPNRRAEVNAAYAGTLRPKTFGGRKPPIAPETTNGVDKKW